MRTHLMPMDIVTHEDKLWVVSTAHEQNEKGKLVNLCGFKRKDRKEQVLQSECKIIEDAENRPRYEPVEGFGFFPDTLERQR